MPFIAVDPRDNRPRIPVSVGDDEKVKCPVCDEILLVRDGPDIARHFYHPPESSCGGESALHLAMKSIAVDKLQQVYPDADVHIEFKTDDVPRRADVFVEFEQPSYPLGKGIAVEVQYRNDSKDLTETSANYLTGGVSVLWLFETNYEGTHPDYDDVDLPTPIPVWPYGVPHSDTADEHASAATYLDLSEEEIISQLPNHTDGQLSLTEFPDPDTTSQATTPDWELNREIHLNISLDTPGARKFYHGWVDGQISKHMDEFADNVLAQRKDARIESRPSYISQPFRTVPGAMFDMVFRSNPPNSGSFMLKKFADETRIHSTRFNDERVAELNMLVKEICYELANSRGTSLPHSEGETVRNSTLGTLSYSLSRTQSNVVVLTTYSKQKPMSVRFHPSNIPELLKFCAKISLWYR